jgi:hypothetical protein
MEGKEWVLMGGKLEEQRIAQVKKTIQKTAMKNLVEVQIREFNSLMAELKRGPK